MESPSDFGLADNLTSILDYSISEIVEYEDPWHEDGQPKDGSLVDPKFEGSFGHVTFAIPVKPIETVRLKLPVSEITVLPVPPQRVRWKDPEWELGNIIHEIVRTNRRIYEIMELLGTREIEGELQEICDGLHEIVTYYVSCYLDNQLGEYWPSKLHTNGGFISGIYQICFPHDKTRSFSTRKRPGFDVEAFQERLA